MSGLTEGQARRVDEIRKEVDDLASAPSCAWPGEYITLQAQEVRDLLSIIDSLTAAVEAREGEIERLKKYVAALDAGLKVEADPREIERLKAIARGLYGALEIAITNMKVNHSALNHKSAVEDDECAKCAFIRDADKTLASAREFAEETGEGETAK